MSEDKHVMCMDNGSPQKINRAICLIGGNGRRYCKRCPHSQFKLVFRRPNGSRAADKQP